MREQRISNGDVLFFSKSASSEISLVSDSSYDLKYTYAYGGVLREVVHEHSIHETGGMGIREKAEAGGVREVGEARKGGRREF